MSEPIAPIFDFQAFASERDSYVRALRELVSGRAFRSAVVEELVLENDFYRRPLRPDDFEFLRFEKPVRAATVSRLPSLASQRTLLCLYELPAALPPNGADPRRLAAFAEYSNERNRMHAARLTPFLEAYAFEYLGKDLQEGGDASLASRLEKVFTQEHQFWVQLFGRLAESDYLQDGLRFSLIQQWCLAPTRRRVLAEARARGHFDGWDAGIAPSLESPLLGDALFRGIAPMFGVDRQQHSYWQFYLPTSLARCNLLYALARCPERSFILYGALYVAQASWLAFEAAIARRCPHLLMNSDAGKSSDVGHHLEVLQQHVAAAARLVSERYGKAAAAQMGQGVAIAGQLAERARWDLGEQLKWLSAVDQYCTYAERISERIELECPDIDRDTFVEPREMCSTTHVHNDHRLVTIQEGVMHFWGNLDMRLQMNPGDKVLIPEGRLHGSTVLSDVCTYHQPIIPDVWVQELLAEEQPEASLKRAVG